MFIKLLERLNLFILNKFIVFVHIFFLWANMPLNEFYHLKLKTHGKRKDKLDLEIERGKKLERELKVKEKIGRERRSLVRTELNRCRFLPVLHAKFHISTCTHVEISVCKYVEILAYKHVEISACKHVAKYIVGVI